MGGWRSSRVLPFLSTSKTFRHFSAFPFSAFPFPFSERVTHQCFRPRASADEIPPAQAKVVVVLFPHARHPDTELLLLRVRVIRKPAG